MRKISICQAFFISIMSIFVTNVTFVFASPEPFVWWAGYRYREGEDYGPFGVSAKIYTIDPYVPNGYAHFQYALVWFSIEREYYLSLGYHKNPPPIMIICFTGRLLMKPKEYIKMLT